MADPHGWASWQEYLNAHTGKLDSYRDHFILEDQLQPVLTPKLVLWRGSLICVDGIRIWVDRRQESRSSHGSIEVITREYVYQATHRIGQETREILRYDNVGAHDHPDKHHRHTFDERGIAVVEWVGKKNWPNLGQFLDMVHDCWQAWRNGDTQAVVSRR